MRAVFKQSHLHLHAFPAPSLTTILGGLFCKSSSSSDVISLPDSEIMVRIALLQRLIWLRS